MVGLLLVIAGGNVGLVRLFFVGGSTGSFVLIVASARLGRLAFMDCAVWEQSLPVP